MSTSTLTVATAIVSVYRAMFTLSGDNVHYQPLLSIFNEKTKIKKYDHYTFSDMTNTNHFELSPSKDSGHSGHPPSLISVLGGRIKLDGCAQNQYRCFCHSVFQINRRLIVVQTLIISPPLGLKELLIFPRLPSFGPSVCLSVFSRY